MTRDFLSVLDDAVEGRCACGCAAVITAASPSAWFAGETCAARWSGRQTWQDVVRQAMEQFRAVLEEVARMIRGALDELLAAARCLAAACNADALRQAGRPTSRPPARIDPGGGISTIPRGRPVFRPARSY